ncbi:MAG: class I SAM-dependent methyltransferase [Geminicoccaceae bacterium]
MSRLDSFIRRLEAQRACLELAAGQIRGLPGPVLELGLGNGRTYDHLRALLPEREIFVFEREVNAHPDCIPDAAHLILGDVRATLPQAHRRLPGPAALAHIDVGTGDVARNAALAAWLAGVLPPLLAERAWVVSDQPLHGPALAPQAPPSGIAPDRYFLYRYEARHEAA